MSTKAISGTSLFEYPPNPKAQVFQIFATVAKMCFEYEISFLKLLR